MFADHTRGRFKGDAANTGNTRTAANTENESFNGIFCLSVLEMPPDVLVFACANRFGEPGIF